MMKGKGLGRAPRGKGDGKGKPDAREINMSARQLDDFDFGRWCERFQLRPPLIGITSLNLSNNALGDNAGVMLGNVLQDMQVPIRIFKLFSNRLADASAQAFARYLQESKHVVSELHLSHNNITREGATELLHAAALASDQNGNARYPSTESVGTLNPVPLWLRLEYNMVADGYSFQDEMERDLLQIRRSKKYLLEGSPSMLCEARLGCGCSSQTCSLLCPGGPGGAPGGPVVHAPHLRKQRRLDELPERARSQLLLSGSAGHEPPLRSVKPAASLPRARSPPHVRFCLDEDEHKTDKEAKVLPSVKPSPYVDVRLRDGELRSPPVLVTAEGATPPAAAAPAEAAVPTVADAPPQSPQQDVADSLHEPTSGLAATQVGQLLNITREVTVSDAFQAGFSPENYLSPLQPGDKVIVKHIEDAWVWAAKVSEDGKATAREGWLALDATAESTAARGGA